MLRRCFASLVLVSLLLTGCGKEETMEVADLPGRPNSAQPPAPPATTVPKLKYQPVIGQHDAQKRYSNDKPFSGNNAVAPQNAPPVKTYIGVVRNVAGNRITVSVNGQDMTFNVSPDAMVSSGNDPRYFPLKGGLANVRSGTQVRLSTQASGGGETVTFLLLTSGAGDDQN